MAETYTIDCCQYCNWSPKIFQQMREGGVDAVHVTICYHEDFRETVEEIVDWNRRFERHGALIAMGRTASDIDGPARRAARRSSSACRTPLPIEDDIGLVEVLHTLGVRFMQLTYNNQSLLGSGCYEAEDSGITRMGRRGDRGDEPLGMVVDMSHSGERSTLEAIDLSARPIAVTHANPVLEGARATSREQLLKALGGARRHARPVALSPPPRGGFADCTLEASCRMVARLRI